MNESDLLRKVQELRAQGSLTDEEHVALEKAVRAKKQLVSLRLAAIGLALSGAVVGVYRMGRSSDALALGLTRHHAQGVIWEERWVSPPPRAPIRFFTSDGVWEYRPQNQQGAGVLSTDFSGGLPAKRSGPVLPDYGASHGRGSR